MFIAATVQLEGQVKDTEMSSANLNRFEFLEILVRLANVKFVESKKMKRIDEATRILIEDYIKPNYTPDPW